MPTTYTFRTAFNGFNREDVVHYIEYINSRHNGQLNQLRSDLAAAQQENATLKAKPQQDPQLEALVAELQAKLVTLEEELLAAQTAKSDLEAQLAETLKEQALRRNEEELAAYRRAERMERQAKERTEALYQKANGVLADATARVDEASAQISGIADHVAAQLTVLQQAVSGSKSALKDAATNLYTICLSADE